MKLPLLFVSAANTLLWLVFVAKGMQSGGAQWGVVVSVLSFLAMNGWALAALWRHPNKF